MKSKTTIEVNGKRYDAVTGEIIGVASAPVVRTGRNIDGFFRARQTPATGRPVPPASDRIAVVAAPAPAPKPHRQPSRTVNHARAHAPQAAHVRVHDAAHAHESQSITVHHTPVAANHTKHHVTQASKTLRREGVQRPLPSFHKQAGTVGTLQHSVPSMIVPKQSVATVDPGRMVRAQSVHRSPQISRHGQKSGPHPTLAPLAVQPVPAPQPNNSGDPIPAPQPPANDPKPDIFTQALMNAEHYVDVHAHVGHFKKQTKRHLASMAAGTLALVVIAGFAAYQNTPGLQFKVASIQAGVSTGMPNFKAAGFAYTGVRASEGKLTVGFKDDTGNYQLTQQTTNLSSGDVIQNISATDASGTPNYTTVQAGDTTIYRFANTDATWVSGGQWYTVNGNSPLTDRQVESLVKNI